MTIFNEFLAMEPHYQWMIFAALLGIAEIILPGVFLIWVSLAALATGVITLLTGIDLTLQLGVFAVAAVLSTYAGRRWYMQNDVASDDPLLNQRASRLIGEVVPAATPFENGRGRIIVGDSEWPARGPDLPKGAKVRITGSDGNALVVEPL